MNSKGEIEAGAILVAFVAIIVGISLYTASLGFIGTATNTETIWNTSVTTSTTPNASTGITGQELITVLAVYNATGATEALWLGEAEANISIYECIDPTDSMKSVCITAKSANADGAYNLSYVYGPDGYIESAGGRSLAGLIAIFAALAIAIVALVPTLKSGVLEMMGK